MTSTHRPTALRIENGPSAVAVRDSCRCALDAGFDGVELPAYEQPRTLPPEPQASACATVQNTGTLDGDETFPVIALAAQITSTETDIAVEEVHAWLEQAGGLRARCVNFTLPPVVHSRDARGFARYQDALNFAYALFRRCRLDVEAAGVPIGVEAAVGGCFLSPVELRELIDAVGCWAIGVCVDARRVDQIGSTTDWLQTLTHRVHALRLHDSVRVAPEAFEFLEDNCPVIVDGEGSAKELREHLARMGCAVRRA